MVVQAPLERLDAQLLQTLRLLIAPRECCDGVLSAVEKRLENTAADETDAQKEQWSLLSCHVFGSLCCGKGREDASSPRLFVIRIGCNERSRISARTVSKETKQGLNK